MPCPKFLNSTPEATAITPLCFFDERTGIIAKRQLFPDVCKQLRRHRAAVYGIEDQQRRVIRREHRFTQPETDRQLALTDVHTVREYACLVRAGVKTHIGHNFLRALCAGQGGQGGHNGRLDALRIVRPTIKDLDACRRYHRFIMLGQRMGRNGLRRAFAAQTVDSKGLVPAHQLKQPVDRVPPLVVDSGADIVDQVFLFTIDVFRQQQARRACSGTKAFRRRVTLSSPEAAHRQEQNRRPQNSP